MPGNDLPTVLLMETLRVGASILMVAGVALVAGAVLTETTADTSKLQKDPYAGSLSLSHARALLLKHSLPLPHFVATALPLSLSNRTHPLSHSHTHVRVHPTTNTASASQGPSASAAERCWQAYQCGSPIVRFWYGSARSPPATCGIHRLSPPRRVLSPASGRQLATGGCPRRSL